MVILFLLPPWSCPDLYHQMTLPKIWYFFHRFLQYYARYCIIHDNDSLSLSLSLSLSFSVGYEWEIKDKFELYRTDDSLLFCRVFFSSLKRHKSPFLLPPFVYRIWRAYLILLFPATKTIDRNRILRSPPCERVSVTFDETINKSNAFF